MWSDPEEIEAWSVSPRGAGWLFGSRVTSEFNSINGLELICRAHQLVQEVGWADPHCRRNPPTRPDTDPRHRGSPRRQGLKYMFPEKSLVTVWSAPNYCYRCGNVASILCFDEQMEREVKYFTETEENSTMCAPRSALPYFL